MDDVESSNAEPSRIPDFNSVAEEAEFWDIHDITDFLDELRETRVRFVIDRPDEQ
jgi:hypothetical protein